MWFEVKVKYSTIDDNGSDKNVTENYMLEAETFGHAEERAHLILSEQIGGDFSVEAEKKVKYDEVKLFDTGDWYFLVVVDMLTFDEVRMKDKKQKVKSIVQADDLKSCYERVEQMWSESLVSFFIRKIEIKNISDVFISDLKNG